ncbi:MULTISPECIES: S-layer homology domain-containing protein [unclassified Leptolyngbya]|nr:MULTISPECIES: S-layer homology domain-containing protein [unclassified Leptolyngbya]MBD1910504.1 S-layer homology domain-containing protein [Leptolyngbya sp. FACHB-8]MBD2153671.1 S-layer homology domain-containing protein [Leptolyngbya sp. FACHB-16]
MGRFREAAILTLMLAIASTVGQPLQSRPEQSFVDAGTIRQSVSNKLQKNKLLTRAELAAILVEAFDVEDRQSSHVRLSHQLKSVNDVPANHWAYLEIQSVIQTGVMTTYPGGNFRPNQTVTRAEGFAAIAQAYGATPPSPQEAEIILKRFPDAREVPDWAKPSLASVISKGWVNVSEDLRLDPDKPLTRGDVAHTLSIYLSQHPTYQRQQSHTTFDNVAISSTGFTLKTPFIQTAQLNMMNP